MICSVVMSSTIEINGQTTDQVNIDFQDTIIVYDTVWVYDTVYVDEIEPIEKRKTEILSPIETNDLNDLQLNLPAQDIKPKIVFYNDLSMQDISLGDENDGAQQDKYLRKKRHKGHSFQLNLSSPFQGTFNPKLIFKGSFSVEGYSGITRQNTHSTIYGNSDRDNNKDYENAFTDITGWEYGLRLNYSIQLISITTGIDAVQLREKFYFVDKFPIDTVIIKETNIHNQIEVPVIFSCQWKLQKADISPKLGFINQFHISSRGKAFSDYKSIEEIEDVLDFTKYNMALYGGVAYNYFLSRHFSVGLDVYYKHPFKKFAEGQFMSVSKNSYGANISLMYRFKR